MLICVSSNSRRSIPQGLLDKNFDKLNAKNFITAEVIINIEATKYNYIAKIITPNGFFIWFSFIKIFFL